MKDPGQALSKYCWDSNRYKFLSSRNPNIYYALCFVVYTVLPCIKELHRVISSSAIKRDYYTYCAILPSLRFMDRCPSESWIL